MERKHIFILLYRRDTWNQDTTGALFTRKQDVGNQSDRLFELHADFILRRQRLRGQEDVFFIKRCFFFLLSQHTRHVLGAQKVYGESYITGINFKLLTSKLSLNLFFLF